jgi:transposase
MGNAKNGNAYLSWAVTELANLIVRFNKTAAKMYARLFKKYGKLRVKAIRSLAARLARAIYHVLKTKEPFDEEKCFGFRVVEAESC